MHHLRIQHLHRQVPNHNILLHFSHSSPFSTLLSLVLSFIFPPLPIVHFIIIILIVRLCVSLRPSFVQTLVSLALQQLLTPLITWPIPLISPILLQVPFIYHLFLLVFSRFLSLPSHAFLPLLLQAEPSSLFPIEPPSDFNTLVLPLLATSIAFFHVLVSVTIVQELSIFAWPQSPLVAFPEPLRPSFSSSFFSFCPGPFGKLHLHLRSEPQKQVILVYFLSGPQLALPILHN